MAAARGFTMTVVSKVQNIFVVGRKVTRTYKFLLLSHSFCFSINISLLQEETYIILLHISGNRLKVGCMYDLISLSLLVCVCFSRRETI